MFSVSHIVFFIIFMVISIAAAILVSKKFGWTKKVLYVACALAIISEVTKVFYLIEETPYGFYLAPEFLPFNLCSIQIIFIFMLTFSNNEKFKKVLMAFMYPTLLGGGIMALLIPTTSVNHGFFTIISFQFWIYHGMLIFLALYMIITRRSVFSIKSYFIALAMMAGALIFAIYLNSAFGNYAAEVNFFFVARPPLDDLPILNFNHGWVVYILHLIWLAILLVSLAYLPVFIKAYKEWRKKRRGETLTTVDGSAPEKVENADEKESGNIMNS